MATDWTPEWIRAERRAKEAKRDERAKRVQALWARAKRASKAEGKRKRWPKDKCCVYVICEAGGHPPVKVGIARNPNRRLELMQTYSPVKLSLHSTVWFNDRRLALDAERQAHEGLEVYRVHREWFQVDPDDALLTILYRLEHWGLKVERLGQHEFQVQGNHATAT